MIIKFSKKIVNFRERRLKKVFLMNDFYNKDEYIENDILSLIKSEAEEDIHTEFKDARALAKDDRKKDEISKDVSAIANSDGGIIIYGIEEENHKANKLSFIDGNVFTKEWLEQIINSRINQKIENVRIYPLRFNGDVSKTIYLVIIPISKSAPHQASDNKYYRRYNFQSVPMEEYEIRNLYARILPVKLELQEPILITDGSSYERGNLRSIRYELGFRVKNIGNTIEKNYKLEIHLPKILQNLHQSYIHKYLTFEDNDFRVYSVPNSSPIFQEETTTHCFSTFSIDASVMKNLTNSIMILRLFFTSGVIEKKYKLLELLTFKGNQLLPENFGL